MQRVLAWLGGNPLRLALASIALIGALGAMAPITDPPRKQRDWYPYLARTSHVEMAAGSFYVTPVSDWSYARGGPTAETYTATGYRFDELRNVWFMLEPQPGSQLAAHTLPLFEFDGGRMLGLTIEARRERNEGYDPIAGVFNAYELDYHWATARDLLTRRVVMLGHEVFIYPIAIDDEEKRTLLERLLALTDRLEREPRYYNTITSNCTNELAKAAGFHWAPAFVLTGRSDEYLHRIGLIAGHSFAQAHARSDMTAYVAALNRAPPGQFDRELLSELRRRFGP